MADRPILFSGPMARALLAGTKTQTRRTMFKKDPPNDGRRAIYRKGAGAWEWRTKHDNFGGTILPQPRIAVGDRLYVREHWRTRLRWDDEAPRDMPSDTPIEYVATPNGDNYGRFRQGMHMPRWASRLTLTVTEVRIERLLDISESDSIAEGAEQYSSSTKLSRPLNPDWKGLYREGYAELWNAINGPGAWEANPWVAAYTFTVRHGNIDQVPR